ncbi:MAG TPA: type II toxin-antitoxin system Phd/YefM family antitoxin [Verrucomicrobiota bacterium]|nr:type II toxin-antitoxin system Phd/YefM family antitoxin [Verrucomicrobiota bacterium]HNU51184.1 type II toxin-antitoxin system Phd/YefM family antitoxin [Verrucomicrobiota bacterium]
MKTLEVGAFEAKTRFSELLRQVEEGCVVRVFRRNRHVADLVRGDAVRAAEADGALDRLAARRRSGRRLSATAICKLRDMGRDQ